MQCIKHPLREAIANCEICSTGLCSNCADRFDSVRPKDSLLLIVCEACLLAHDRKVVRDFLRHLAFTGLWLIGGTALAWLCLDVGFSLPASAIVAAIPPCSYWGWQYLRNSFISCLRQDVMANCWGAKSMLAMCIGPFVTPYLIFREARRTLMAHRMMRRIERVQI